MYLYTYIMYNGPLAGTQPVLAVNIRLSSSPLPDMARSIFPDAPHAVPDA